MVTATSNLGMNKCFTEEKWFDRINELEFSKCFSRGKPSKLNRLYLHFQERTRHAVLRNQKGHHVTTPVTMDITVVMVTKAPGTMTSQENGGWTRCSSIPRS